MGVALASSAALQLALEELGKPQRTLLPTVVLTVFHAVHVDALTTVLTTVQTHFPSRLQQWLLVPLDAASLHACR